MSQSGSLGGGGVGPSSGVQTLTGNSGGAVPPDVAFNVNVVGGTNVSVVGNPATHTLTINASGGGGLSWHSISASQTLAVNNGYFCIGGGSLSLLLPTTSVEGDQIIISLDGSNSFTINQSAGQTIKYGSQETNLGVAGSLATTKQGDTVTLVCQIPNLRWNCISSIGNLTTI